MEPYRFFDHTADVKFQAYGKTLEQAFANAAYAMFKVFVESEVQGKVTKSITVQGADLKALLYNFLEEFLFLLDSQSFLLSKMDSLKINNFNKEYVLTAMIKGDYQEGQYTLNTQIKAVTYDQMEVKEEKDQAMVQVVVDI